MVPTVVVPVMTLGNCVFLPQQLLPLRIFEPRYRKMLKETLAGSRMFAISQLDEDSLSPDNDEPPCPFTCVGRIVGHVEREDGTSHIVLEGLRRARELLLQINAMGLPAGTEFLDLLSPQYISDLVAWGAIGARTTESQSHRQLASGLSCPVGFKNGTDGGTQVAADALQAAAAPHAFMGMTKMGVAAIFETRGNPDGHLILRGGRVPNFDAEGVDAACAVLARAGLREQVMVDCSHANSAKQHRRQVEVAADLARRIAAGDRRLVGVMVESHLHEGRQDLQPGQPLQPGVSITDACIGWAQTEPLLQALADAVRQRRQVR